jgi:hypothetical protein
MAACDCLFSVMLYNCATRQCFDTVKSSFGCSVSFVDIDEPFFILVKASIADYKDYICTFQLNGCDLGFTLHGFCGSGKFLCGVPNKDGDRLRSMCVTSSTNPGGETISSKRFNGTFLWRRSYYVSILTILSFQLQRRFVNSSSQLHFVLWPKASGSCTIMSSFSIL